MGQTAQSLTCSIMEKPHTGLGECPRILLLCFRARNSGGSGIMLLPKWEDYASRAVLAFLFKRHFTAGLLKHGEILILTISHPEPVIYTCSVIHTVKELSGISNWKVRKSQEEFLPSYLRSRERKASFHVWVASDPFGGQIPFFPPDLVNGAETGSFPRRPTHAQISQIDGRQRREKGE